MSRRRGGAGTGATTAWVVLTGMLVVPLLALGGWWAVAHADNPTQAAAPVAPVVVPVTREDVRARTTVAVAVGDAPGRDVTVAASGTVTAVAAAGTVLAPGTEVLRLDDRPVTAMVGAAPLWRTLRAGDTGADVRRLQEHLVAVGLLRANPDGRFGADTERAVVRLNRDAGRGAAVREMDPATVVWVGPEPLTVAEVPAAVGTTVAPGAVVARGPARAGAVEVTEPPGGVDSAGAYGGDARLVVGDVEVPYVPGSGAVRAPEDVERVRAALAPAAEGTVELVAAVPREVVVVPASALVTGADGSTCVYPGPGARPVVVAPVGGGVSTSQLPPDVGVDEVLANPGRAAVDHPCGS